MNIRLIASFILFSVLFSSCELYRRDVLFKAPKEKEAEFLKASYTIRNPKNYLINKNDYLEFILFSNNGEILVDPTSEFAKQVTSAGGSSSRVIKYLVQSDGCVDLPIIGHTKIDSLNIHQCDSLLANLYGKYYLDVFVLSKVSNPRVYILGLGTSASSGGGGNSVGRAQVVTLDHENTTLFEIIAQNGGVGLYSFTNRVKIIRGNLANPTIFTVDISRWNTYQQSNLVVQPNDIIYIEPLRRGALEFLRDFSQISGIVTILLSFYIITRVN
jgi:polysaccharide export outer membrane protein